MTEPAKDPDPQPRRLSSTAWAVLTAALALAGSVVSLAFTLCPSLKPDPLDQVGATLSVVAIEPNVRIEDWAKHAYPKSWERHLQDIFGVERPSPGNLGTGAPSSTCARRSTATSIGRSACSGASTR